MPRKDSSWIEQSGLHGTWTFTTQTMTDAGYYKGIAYVVMHLMPDPMQVQSCVIEGDPKEKTKGCVEADNRACSHTDAADNEHEDCVDTETTDVEWSDVTAFFQFGYQFRTGIVRKTYHNVHTSDWLGPYNMILAPIESGKSGGGDGHADAKDRKDLYVSRYVTAPWTAAQLQRPFASSAIFDFDSNVLEDVVGTTAINQTIRVQKGWRGKTCETRFGAADDAIAPEEVASRVGLRAGGVLRAGSDDPYAKYSGTCAHGDLRPILPRLEVVRTTHPSRSDDSSGDSKHPKTTYSMKLDYNMLSVPERIDDLYKLVPTMKKHFGGRFPLRGPYCYGNDPNRAYAIHLSYDSSAKPGASTWHGVRGCVAPWPCWKDDPNPPALPPSSVIPEDNRAAGSYVLDPKGVEFLIIYGVGFLLLVSLVFNCRLALKLRRSGGTGGSGADVPNQQQQQQQRPAPPPSAFLRTPIRSRGDDDDNSNNSSNVDDHDAATIVASSNSSYLREAAGDRGNSLEEPLLTASSDEMDRDRPPPSGAEESKREEEEE